MEKINDFIQVVIATDESPVEKSVCYCHVEGDQVNFTFILFHQDCFFGMNRTNYRIAIHIDQSYFEKYGEPFELVNREQSTCCKTQGLLLEIVDCTHQGLNRKIFLEGIILQLIHMVQRNPLVLPFNCENCSFANKPQEIEKIDMARNFILQHLNENLTIPQLASYVGTNQCYLKKGFKELMGATIFEFIQENRMNTAKQLLQSGFYFVSDVSVKVGYSSISSFSQAFKNYYGSNPSVFQKKLIEAN